MINGTQMNALILRAMKEGASPENNFDKYHDYLLMQTNLEDDGLDELLAQRPELAYDVNKSYEV
jgi:hypothetical protein